MILLLQATGCSQPRISCSHECISQDSPDASQSERKVRDKVCSESRKLQRGAGGRRLEDNSRICHWNSGRTWTTEEDASLETGAQEVRPYAFTTILIHTKCFTRALREAVQHVRMVTSSNRSVEIMISCFITDKSLWMELRRLWWSIPMTSFRAYRKPRWETKKLRNNKTRRNSKRRETTWTDPHRFTTNINMWNLSHN